MLGLELHVLARGEVLRDVGARAENPLLFPAPEREPHGAIQAQIQRLEDAHHLDHHGAAGGVVGRARAGVPAIEVRADHHDLVSLPAAGNVADDVDRIHAVVEEARFDVEFELHRDLVIEQARDAVVVLRRQHDHRRRDRIFRIARAAALREQRASFAAARCGANDHRRAFIGEELVECAHELRVASAWPTALAAAADRGGSRRCLATAARPGIRHCRRSPTITAILSAC